ncbi:MAG: hypothetical protein GY783_20115 [Gammaproteobacteria bacterium]|nr:hypothetical protein [Gammaproteobacteria bacterium]
MNARLLFSVVIFALSLQITACARNEVSFAADVQPILQESCLECHDGTGEGLAASGFSVVSYADVMKGTDLGPVVIAGSSMSSALYLVVAGKTAPEIRMPPHHSESFAEGRGAQLSAGQIEIVAGWIDQGAKDN